jgi:hypothetical protein
VRVGVSVTCNNELYLHLSTKHIDATFNAVECVLTSLVLCVFHSVVLCSYEDSIRLFLFYIWWMVAVFCYLVFNSYNISWLQIQRFRVRFLALPDLMKNSGSGTGSTQPREDN